MNQSFKTTVYTVEHAKDLRNNMVIVKEMKKNCHKDKSWIGAPSVG